MEMESVYIMYYGLVCSWGLLHLAISRKEKAGRNLSELFELHYDARTRISHDQSKQLVIYSCAIYPLDASWLD